MRISQGGQDLILVATARQSNEPPPWVFHGAINWTGNAPKKRRKGQKNDSTIGVEGISFAEWMLPGDQKPTSNLKADGVEATRHGLLRDEQQRRDQDKEGIELASKPSLPDTRFNFILFLGNAIATFAE